jgi:hypothetical protein
MKNHLKFIISSLTLLAILGFTNPVLAENNATSNTAVKQQISQDNKTTKPPAIKLLAWQRVGAPISLAG